MAFHEKQIPRYEPSTHDLSFGRAQGLDLAQVHPAPVCIRNSEIGHFNWE